MLGIMDRVYETSTTTGTGNFTLAGEVAKYVEFSAVYAVSVSAKFPYTIENQSANEWEVGIGYLGGVDTLVRETVVNSSNAGAKVNFSAGTKKVISALNSQFLASYIAQQIAPAANVPDQVTNLVASTTNQATGSVQLTWAEPSNGGSDITSYLIEYKLNSAGTWTVYNNPIPDAEIAVIPSLTTGTLYNFRVSAVNAIGTGTVSSTVNATPQVSNSIYDIFTTGLEAWWDGKTYAGSGTWNNQIAVPASGAAQAAYNVTPTNVALWSTNKWVMDGSSNFDIGTNTNFVRDMHKTQTGNVWTLNLCFKTPLAAIQTDTLFATADVAGNFGIRVRADSGGALKLDQLDGTTLKTLTLGTLLANTRYKVTICYDHSTGLVYSAVNANTLTSVSSNWTAAVTGNATHPMKIGADGDGSNDVDSGVEIQAVALLNKRISNTELANWNSFLDVWYDPPATTVPGQVYPLIGSPADTKAFLAWNLLSDGGSSIINYVVEYKATSSGTWLPWTHNSTNKYATITGLTNGTSYDFRVSGVSATGTGAVSSTFTMTPNVPGTQPYSRSAYKLTTPRTQTGQFNGSAYEIVQPAFLTYEGPEFTQVNGTFLFVCPDGGATTATASYCRAELRHLTNIPATTPTEDTLKFSVVYIPDNQKTVVHQIHDLDDPWVKLVYTGKDNGTGLLRALYKATHGAPDTTVVLKTGISNGTQIKSRIVYTGTALQFWIDDVLISSVTVTYSTETYFWKRGNYYQNNLRVGTYCIVAHHLQAGAYP